jgi:hypothetical protein
MSKVPLAANAPPDAYVNLVVIGAARTDVAVAASSPEPGIGATNLGRVFAS